VGIMTSVWATELMMRIFPWHLGQMGNGGAATSPTSDFQQTVSSPSSFTYFLFS
jgi:hypothetical protein